MFLNIKQLIKAKDPMVAFVSDIELLKESLKEKTDGDQNKETS